MHEIIDVAVSAGVLVAELLLLFVAVSFLVVLANRRLGPQQLRQWLGGRPVVGAFKGVVVGLVTPFCSYSTIPVLVGLLKAGVPVATSASFLLASPVLDPVVVVAVAALFGVDVAIGYTAVTVACALTSALLAETLGADQLIKPGIRVQPPARSTPEAIASTARRSGSRLTVSPEDGCQQEASWRGLRTESGEALRSALGETRRLLRPMLAAVAIGALIYGAVPRRALVAVAGPGNPFAVPTAALLGVPLYLPAEALLPIGVALLNKGMGVGAVFAMLIGAAGVNLPEFGLLTAVLRPSLIAALVTSVFLTAIAGGLLIPLI